jgi:hypothetical protein
MAAPEPKPFRTQTLPNGDLRILHGDPELVKNKFYVPDQSDPTLLKAQWPKCKKRANVRRKRRPIPACNTYINLTVCKLTDEMTTPRECFECTKRQP